jgi:uncharacterized protein YidB (DUF937 family)
MDFGNLLQMGASLIQNNDDDATSGLDAGAITGALSGLLGGNEEGGLDLGSLMGNLMGSDGESGGLMETVSSWVGNGENMPIDADQVTDLLGSDKISAFAENLGIDFESAKGALADALPAVVNEATPGDEGNDLLGGLLDKVGGTEGAMGMLGKLFG